MRQDLYRIDDVLLRAAGAAALAVLVAAIGILFAGLATSPDGLFLDGLRALARHALPLAAAAACPVALLAAARRMRARERQVASLWSLLRQNVVLSVPELLASSDFTRSDVERAVRFLNNRGLAHYVCDRERDAIEDGRLRTMRVHVEKCESCGGEVALELAIGDVEPPRCSFCHGAVSSRSHEELREEVIGTLRDEGRERRPPASRLAFSIPVFVLLLIVCWPAAIAYAVYKQQAA